MEVRYVLYLGNGGNRSPHGTDRNNDKGIGGRIRLETAHLKLGGSYYTADDDTAVGRKNLTGVDLEVSWGRARLETEYTIEQAEEADDRFGYYIRMTFDAGRAAPFVAYDYLEDRRDLLFERGMVRYSTGLGYTVNNHMILKGETHYHFFKDDSGLGGVPKDIQMIMASAIFLF